jgi:hypothetical protein
MPNANVCARETLNALCLLLLQNAEEFALLNDAARVVFIQKRARTAFNRCIRRLPEVQPAPAVYEGETSEDDFGTIEQDCTISYGRADWKVANAEEDAMIARIDAERSGIKEPEPESRYEWYVRVLGEDGDWLHSYEMDDLFRQRSVERAPKSPADRKRAERLRSRLRA